MSFQIKKFQIPKILSTWVSAASKCQQNFKILQLAWTLVTNKFWTKCLRCLIFAKTIVFHSYLMEITTFISIWLQLNHHGSSNLLKNFNKLNFLDFPKKLKFLFLVNLHHSLEHYEARKVEEPIWSEKWGITA